MPNYTYTCFNCDTDQERFAKIDDRDKQTCEKCGYKLNRNWNFEGIVWSPTSNGGHK